MVKTDLKYRIFDKRHKEFRYWGFIGEMFVGPPTGSRMSIEECRDNSEKFTGMKDSKGKEIYEGDIRRETVEFDEGDEVFYFVCVWIMEWSMFAWLSTTDYEYKKYLAEGAEALDTASYWTYPLQKGEKNTFIVCGNIHERPELLKK